MQWHSGIQRALDHDRSAPLTFQDTSIYLTSDQLPYTHSYTRPSMIAKGFSVFNKCSLIAENCFHERALQRCTCTVIFRSNFSLRQEKFYSLHLALLNVSVAHPLQYLREFNWYILHWTKHLTGTNNTMSIRTVIAGSTFLPIVLLVLQSEEEAARESLKEIMLRTEHKWNSERNESKNMYIEMEVKSGYIQRQMGTFSAFANNHSKGNPY